MNQKNDAQLWQAWQDAVRQEVKKRPWLSSLLLQKRSRLFERFSLFYNRLRAAPRQLRRKLAVGVAAAALMLALSGAPTPVQAATITVGPGCTLVQAIQSANTDTSVGSCTAGSGADTIVLAGGTYSYTTINGTASALPDITSEITIEANGAIIQRTSGNMRIIRVDGNGDLTLNDATIRGGSGVNFAGGILNDGTLTLNNSVVSNNSASGSNSTGGGILNNGALTLNNSAVNDNSVIGVGSIHGGGVMNVGTLTLNNSDISGNQASAGGGIANRGTTILNDSNVSNNTVSRVGGGIDNSEGTLTLNNSVISGNTATIAGGGIHNRASANLNDSIVSGNRPKTSEAVTRRKIIGLNPLNHTHLTVFAQPV